MENLTFRLTDFEGPLDLLLYLISKNKMKIADIEIVSLIDQYLEIVNGPQGASLDAGQRVHRDGRPADLYEIGLSSAPQRRAGPAAGGADRPCWWSMPPASGWPQTLGQMAQGPIWRCAGRWRWSWTPPTASGTTRPSWSGPTATLWAARSGGSAPRRSGLSRWWPRPLSRWPAGWSMCCAIWSRGGCNISPRCSAARRAAARTSAPFWRCSSCSRRAGSRWTTTRG